MAGTKKQLYVTTRGEWRDWLERNHKKENEVWLVYYKKHTGKPRIPYDDAVEEALCFGWIDSIVKRVDEETYIQKYTPRKDRSIWSELNKRRALKMIRQKRMTRAGLAKIDEAKKSGEWTKERTGEEAATLPPKLEKALAANEKARDNFNNFTPNQRRQYVGWILSAKREDTRDKRIAVVVERSARNEKPGMM